VDELEMSMLAHVPLLAAATLTAMWGVMHLVKTAPIVAGFEPLSDDNRHWSEGITAALQALRSEFHFSRCADPVRQLCCLTEVGPEAGSGS
jgi:hypothetical protein